MANVTSTKTTPQPPGPVAAAQRTAEKGGVVPPRPGRGGGLNLGEYLRGVREELKKAQWPTREELIRLTQVVLGVIAVVALFVGALDGALGWLTSRFFGFGR